MLIREIMSAEVFSLAPAATLLDAAALMKEKHIGFVLIADQGRALGVLTEGDMVGFLMDKGVASEAVIGDYMHAPVLSVCDEDSVFDVYELLRLHGVRHFPVCDKSGRLQGVITMSSLIAAMGVEYIANAQRLSEVCESLQTVVDADTPVETLLSLMQEHRHAMVAVDQEGKPVGIVSSRTLTRLWLRKEQDWSALSMRDLMIAPTCLHEHALIPEAVFLMKTKRTRHVLLTYDDGRLRGLVTIGAIARSLGHRYIAFVRSVTRDIDSLADQRQASLTMFERNPNAVLQLDLSATIERVNAPSLCLFACAEDDLLQQPLWDLLRLPATDSVEDLIAHLALGESEGRYCWLCLPSGSLLEVYASFVPILTHGVLSGFYVVLLDLSERLKADREQQKLAHALQQVQEAVMIVDQQGIIEFVNFKADRLFGYHTGKLLGMSLQSLEQAGSEGSYQQKLWPALLAGYSCKAEIMHRHADGSSLDLQVLASCVNVSEAHRSSCYVLMFVDMSVLRAEQAREIDAQKMQAVSVLVSGVGHEFNHYLAAVSGLVHLLQQAGVSYPAAVTEQIDKLNHLAEHASLLVGQLLSFSKRQPLQKKTMDVAKVLAESRLMIDSILPNKLSLQWQLQEGFVVYACAMQIKQVLLALVENAIQAQRADTESCLSLRLQSASLTGSEYAVLGLRSDVAYVHLSLRDHGCGIAKEDLPHVFEPFFSTRPRYESTGMGLSMAYAVLKEHEGAIHLDSEQGVGTQVNVYLPLCSETAAVSSEKAEYCKDVTVNKHLLLVDDEELMRELGVDILSMMGYEVTTAASGSEGLALFKQDPDRYDVALLDMMMPGMSGLQLSEVLRALRPSLPILFVTGYSEQDISPELLAQAHTGYLPKPWTVAEMKEALEDVLRT